MSTLSIIGVILGLAVLVYGSMKGFSVFISAICGSVVMALFSGLSLNDAILGSFVDGLVGFIKGNFMVFAAGALMGKVYEITFGAKAVARLFVKLFSKKFAPFAVLVAIWVMTWGGIAGFVLAFSVFPIALEVFREADLPRSIIPGVVICGCCCASSWGPGVAQPVNNIMATGFGVSLMAAPVPSIIMAAASCIFSCLMMGVIFKRARANGEHFVANEKDIADDVTNLPNGVVALLPIIVALILINVKVGEKTLMPTAFGIFTGAVLGYILMFKFRNEKAPITNHIGSAFGTALTSIGNTGAMVAVGSVAKATAGFTLALDSVTGMGGSPVVSAAIAAMIMSFICGGATGATGLLAPILAPIYTGMGANLAMVGRIVNAAGHVGGLMPNGGFVNTVITGIANDTYKNCFKYTLIIATLSNLFAVIVGIIVMSIMGVYI